MRTPSSSSIVRKNSPSPYQSDWSMFTKITQSDLIMNTTILLLLYHYCESIKTDLCDIKIH